MGSYDKEVDLKQTMRQHLKEELLAKGFTGLYLQEIQQGGLSADLEKMLVLELEERGEPLIIHSVLEQISLRPEVRAKLLDLLLEYSLFDLILGIPNLPSAFEKRLAAQICFSTSNQKSKKAFGILWRHPGLSRSARDMFIETTKGLWKGTQEARQAVEEIYGTTYIVAPKSLKSCREKPFQITEQRDGRVPVFTNYVWQVEATKTGIIGGANVLTEVTLVCDSKPSKTITIIRDQTDIMLLSTTASSP